MSPTSNHTRRICLSAFAVALVLAFAHTAGADPKPGSSGRVFGPPLPVATAKAAPKKRAAPRTVLTKKPARGAPRSLPGLGQGARGAAVLAMQTRLAELHYDVELTGVFDYTTLEAVIGFQKVNDLPRTGRATESMLTALQTATNPSPMIPTGGQNRIEVDLKKQFLGLYKGGELFKLLPISSGSGKDFCVTDPDTSKTVCDKAITPGGSFRIRSRIIGWRESKLGLLYNPLYFNGGIAFHGAPVVPSTPASHGCVRIPMPSAEWFPNEVANGTAVYVFGGEKAPVPFGEKAPTDLKPNATAPSTTADPALTIPGGSTTTVAGGVVGAPTTVGGIGAAPTTTVTGSTPSTLVKPGAGASSTTPPRATTTIAPTPTTVAQVPTTTLAQAPTTVAQAPTTVAQAPTTLEASVTTSTLSPNTSTVVAAAVVAASTTTLPAAH